MAKKKGIKELSVGRSDVYMIDPDTIKIDPEFNVRMDGIELEEHIEWLTASIMEEGVKEPLTGYLTDDGFCCTNGHCRIKAVKKAKERGAEILSVPCRLEDRYSKAEDRTLSLITRNSGLKLSQLELGEVLKRLVKYGWTTAQISQKTGFSPQHIGNILTLSGAPTQVTNMVKDGKVSSTLAVKALRDEGPEGAAGLLQQSIDVAEDGGKKKATQKHVDTVKKVKKKKVSWGTFGPRMHELIKKIYEDPEEYPDGFAEYLQEAGDILAEVEDLYGDILSAKKNSKQKQTQLPI